MISHLAAISAMEASTAATSRRERQSIVTSFLFRLSLFDVYSAAVDFSHRVVLDQVLCHALILEGHKAESTRRSCVYIL